jgi:hypothetical protein
MGGFRVSSQKPRRDPKDRPLKSDKRVRIPLDFEQALGGILRAGPHPKEDEPELTESKEKAPRKGRLKANEDG